MASGPDAAIELHGVSVRYRIAREAIDTLKEYAIRKLRGRLEHGELLALADVSLVIRPGERSASSADGAGRAASSGSSPASGSRTPGASSSAGRWRPFSSWGRLPRRADGARERRPARDPHGRRGGRCSTDGPDRGVRRAGGVPRHPDPELLDRHGGPPRLRGRDDIGPRHPPRGRGAGRGDERFRPVPRADGGFRERGKTFLLVSHLLDEVRETCTRALWLSDGRIVATARPARSATPTRLGAV